MSDYPLLKHCYPDWEAKAIEMFNDLKAINYTNRLAIATVDPLLVSVKCKAIKLGFKTRTGIKKYIITHKETDFWQYNTISDLFTEEVRIECKKKGHDTPLEYWNKHKHEIIREVGLNFATQYDKTLTLRETAYQKNGNGRNECTIHRPIVTIVLIRYFNAKRILDPCAGWGGRMIAALSTECELYVGVDPNEKLHPHYNNIRRIFGAESQSQVYCTPFEEFEWNGPKFDLVYTSPPYFDLEEYGDLPTQSIKRFVREQQWVKGFLLPMLQKCINYTRPNGIIAINITETGRSNYMKDMLEFMHKRQQEYLGVIGFVGRNPAYAMPILIWRVKT